MGDDGPTVKIGSCQIIVEIMQHKHHVYRQGREPIFKSGSGILIATDVLELLKHLLRKTRSNTASSFWLTVESCGQPDPDLVQGVSAPQLLSPGFTALCATPAVWR